MNKIILFDLDGTLIDSTEAILNGFKYSFSKNKTNIKDSKEIASLIGYTLEDMFFKLGVNKELLKDHVLAYKEFYSTIYLEQTTLLPYAYEAVKLASSFAKLGVVTTKSSNFLQELLDKLQIGSFFEVLVGRNDVTNPKPNKEPIELAINKISISTKKSKIYMIGDTPIDTLAAKNAGIIPLSVTCGYSDINLLKKSNTNIFNNPLEAVQFAEKR